MTTGYFPPHPCRRCGSLTTRRFFCSRECASNGGQDRPPDPTPEEIAAACRGIQAGEIAIGIRPVRAWDDEERRKRAGAVVRYVEAEEVSLGELLR